MALGEPTIVTPGDGCLISSEVTESPSAHNDARVIQDHTHRRSGAVCRHGRH